MLLVLHQILEELMIKYHRMSKQRISKFALIFMFSQTITKFKTLEVAMCCKI